MKNNRVEQIKDSINKATALTKNGDFDSAAKIYKDAYELGTDLCEKSDLDEYRDLLGIICQKYSGVLRKTGRKREALERCTESIELYKELIRKNKDNNNEYYAKLSDSYTRISGLVSWNTELDKAFEYENKALKIRQDLAEKDPDKYTHKVWDSLHGLALMADCDGMIEGMAKKSEQYFKESIKVASRLIEINEEQYGGMLSTSYFNMASLLERNNKLEEAREAFMNAYNTYVKLMDDYPDKYAKVKEAKEYALKAAQEITKKLENEQNER